MMISGKDFSRKVFSVTLTGTDWNGQPITVAKTVEVHGDAEAAKRVVILQDYPVQVRKVASWVIEQVA